MIAVSAIFWDPNPICFTLPYINWPIFWYGILFALGFALGFPLCVSVLTRVLGEANREKAVQIVDRLTVYMVLATVIGARLGHFLFYESPEKYIRDLWELFRTWEGGLASHGAAAGILIALWFFAKKMDRFSVALSWACLLDCVSIPAAFAGGCIRIGNFINQEILGVPTSVAWAVIFGHPADQGLVIARHPVQIYEAAAYFFVFGLLWYLSYQKSFLRRPGRLIGLFLILVFSSRFFLELFKEEQSVWLHSFPLTMGQILSIPAVLGGAAFFLFSRPENKLDKQLSCKDNC